MQSQIKAIGFSMRPIAFFVGGLFRAVSGLALLLLSVADLLIFCCLSVAHL
jgi:hypothetical protein